MAEDDPTSCEPKALGPGSVETIRNALEYRRAQRTAWIERYFPEVAQRGYLDYADIERMDRHQAEAVRYLLVDQILFWRMKKRKAQISSVTFLPDPRDQDRDLEWRIRLRLSCEALAELCSIYSLENPLVDA